MEQDHLNMQLLGSAGGIPPTKRPKLDSTTSEDSGKSVEGGKWVWLKGGTVGNGILVPSF